MNSGQCQYYSSVAVRWYMGRGIVRQFLRLAIRESILSQLSTTTSSFHCRIVIGSQVSPPSGMRYPGSDHYAYPENVVPKSMAPTRTKLVFLLVRE